MKGKNKLEEVESYKEVYTIENEFSEDQKDKLYNTQLKEATYELKSNLKKDQISIKKKLQRVQQTKEKQDKSKTLTEKKNYSREDR